MTTAVKLFAHAGVVSVPVANSALQASDQAFLLLKQPYGGNETLSCDTSTADTSDAANAPKGTTCARVEVETGKVCHYEVTPQNATLRTATANSPTIEGRSTLQFGEGWRLSVLEQS